MLQADHLRQVHLDFQTVGLHRLHTQVLRDGACAHLETGLPHAGFIGHIGRHGEAVDVVHRLAVHLLGIEATCGVHHLEDDGVVSGDGRIQIVEHEVELQLIARTPHAAVAVGEGGDALFDGLASDIEAAVR